MAKQIIILLLTLVSGAFSQGFDWQFDYRLPFTMPNKFLGAAAAYTSGGFNGGLNLHENNTYCCELTKGMNSGYQAGIAFEYWDESLIFENEEGAVTLSLVFKQANDKFSRTQSVPKSQTTNLITEFSSETNKQIIDFKLGYKNRLFSSMFSLEFGLWCNYMLSKENILQEKVISPNNFDFGNGNVVRTINGSTQNLKSICSGIYLSAVYDLDLGYGQYLSPFIEFRPPIISEFDNTSTASYSLLFGTKILFSF